MSEREREREKIVLFWLMQIEGIGPVKLRQCYEKTGSFACLYNIEEKEAMERKLFSETDWRHLQQAKKHFAEREESYHTLAERGIQFISFLDESYPKRLLFLHDRPAALFVRGKLPSEGASAAIVGARNCSLYGKSFTEYLARKLSEQGIQIVSGLAAGIDGAAHRGALEAGGETFGVLGCGITRCYPDENYPLYEAMLTQGGVISEYAPSVLPLAGNFPARNRIISGLADAILVMEAGERSGALITVEMALEQGKEIFALPGRATDRLSRGCNRLIQNGASILLTGEEVLDYFSLRYQKKLNVYEKNINRLAKPQKMLYSFLDSEPKCLEEIVKKTGMGVSTCVNALLELELQGYIRQTAGLFYRIQSQT